MASVHSISVEELIKKADFEHFEKDFDLPDISMHRFPVGLRGVGERYVVPMVVAIGPYHHNASDHLQKMEVVKRAAAYHLIKDWESKAREEVYKAVLDVAGRVRKLYAEDALNGMGDPAVFAAMMFIDACFLLQYMDAYPSFESPDGHVDGLLLRFLFSLRSCIDNDIMLLENQLPWLVVKTIMDNLPDKDYMNVVGMFIARMGNTFKICEDDGIKPFLDWGSSPPHLLGLLRRHKTEPATQVKWPELKRLSASSAIELAEIGIKLTARKEAVFTDMDVTERGPLCGELSLAPLSLNDTRACWLVNMAAFEVATASSYQDHDSASAVCSYLGLLSMFMLRQEDVHELRSKCILQGHQSNAEMLTFFNSVVKHLPDTGSRFAYIMACIEDYKKKRWMRTKVHKFVYNNFTTIIKVLTIVGILLGIFKAFLSLKQGQKNDTPGQYLSLLPA